MVLEGTPSSQLATWLPLQWPEHQRVNDFHIVGGVRPVATSHVASGGFAFVLTEAQHRSHGRLRPLQLNIFKVLVGILVFDTGWGRFFVHTTFRGLLRLSSFIIVLPFSIPVDEGGLRVPAT